MGGYTCRDSGTGERLKEATGRRSMGSWLSSLPLRQLPSQRYSFFDRAPKGGVSSSL
jgi:hypothetical protein